LEDTRVRRTNRNRKILAEAMYIAGEQPSVIAKQLRLTPSCITEWSKQGKWADKRDKHGEEVVAEYKELVVEITNLALKELKRLLESDTKDVDKISAIRSALDISGLKRDNKNIEFGTGGIEVVINQKPIRKQS
jgi:uncharacterized protein YjcR